VPALNFIVLSISLYLLFSARILFPRLFGIMTTEGGVGSSPASLRITL